LKNFARYKPDSLANQVRLMCVVCFLLIGCSKYEQQAETIDVAYHLHGLWARNAAQVWVVGDAGDILHSTDGGEHWQQQKSGTQAQLISIYGSDSQLWICRGGWHNPAFEGRRRALAAAKERDNSSNVRASIKFSLITTCCGVFAPKARSPSREAMSLTAIKWVV
jgi:hypothetical protein